MAADEMLAAMTTAEKQARKERKKALRQRVAEEILLEYPDREKEVDGILETSRRKSFGG